MDAIFTKNIGAFTHEKLINYIPENEKMKQITKWECERLVRKCAKNSCPPSLILVICINIKMPTTNEVTMTIN